MKTKKDILRSLDRYLQTLKGMIITGLLLSIIFYLIIGGDIVTRILSALFLSVCTIWFYRSSRKYGFDNTAVFFFMFPLMLLFSIANTGQKESKEKQDKKTPIPEDLVQTISSLIEELINETHACTIEKSDIQDDGVYVHLKIPYGIHPPYEEITQTLSKKLHIPRDLIVQSDYSPTHTYYYFSRNAIDHHLSYKSKQYPWMTFKGCLDRLFLLAPLP